MTKIIITLALFATSVFSQTINTVPFADLDKYIQKGTPISIFTNYQTTLGTDAQAFPRTIGKSTSSLIAFPEGQETKYFLVTDTPSTKIVVYKCAPGTMSSTGKSGANYLNEFMCKFE